MGRHIIILFRGNSRGYYYSGGYDFQTSREIPQGTITGEGTIIRNARVYLNLSISLLPIFILATCVANDIYVSRREDMILIVSVDIPPKRA